MPISYGLSYRMVWTGSAHPSTLYIEGLVSKEAMFSDGALETYWNMKALTSPMDQFTVI